jgi:hypothetical protein
VVWIGGGGRSELGEGEKMLEEEESIWGGEVKTYDMLGNHFHMVKTLLKIFSVTP